MKYHFHPIMYQHGIRLCVSLLFIVFFAFLFTYLPTTLTTTSTLINAPAKKELPIYSVDCDSPMVAISFDAAWGNEDTKQILSILKEHNVKTTFFMTGGWVSSYPEDVKSILAAGHDLGNHSEHHKNMSTLSAVECKEELMAVHNRVKELTGYEMTLFRPPYGDYDDKLIRTARSCDYYSIQWDVDSLDWKNYGVEAIVDQVLNHKSLQNGSIILMHNGAKYTKEALPSILTGLKEKGFTIVPISELILKDNFYMDHTGRQIKK